MGRAFVFGDDVSTDALAPGAYMKGEPAEIAAHCLEAIAPDFAKQVVPGDVVVGGANFGMGSSREQAASSLQLLGVSAVLARSFARIFYRNIINLGVPAVVFAWPEEIRTGDEVVVDVEAGRVENLSTRRTYDVEPLPNHLMVMIRDGGLLPHLKRRLGGHGVSA